MTDEIKMLIYTKIEELRQEAAVEVYPMVQFVKWLHTEPMGISRQTLYDWMSGKSKPNVRRLKTIVDNFANEEQAEFLDRIINLYE